DELGEARRSHAMSGDAAGKPVGGVKATAGESAIRAKLAWQAGQKPGRTDVREEPDSNLGHGKPEGIASHPVRAVDGYPGATPHPTAINDRQVGLAIALNHCVEPVLTPPERQRIVVVAAASKLIDRPQIATS